VPLRLCLAVPHLRVGVNYALRLCPLVMQSTKRTRHCAPLAEQAVKVKEVMKPDVSSGGKKFEVLRAVVVLVVVFMMDGLIAAQLAPEHFLHDQTMHKLISAFAADDQIAVSPDAHLRNDGRRSHSEGLPASANNPRSSDVAQDVAMRAPDERCDLHRVLTFSVKRNNASVGRERLSRHLYRPRVLAAPMDASGDETLADVMLRTPELCSYLHLSHAALIQAQDQFKVFHEANIPCL
jgi:hypothetical protein